MRIKELLSPTMLMFHKLNVTVKKPDKIKLTTYLDKIQNYAKQWVVINTRIVVT